MASVIEGMAVLILLPLLLGCTSTPHEGETTALLAKYDRRITELQMELSSLRDSIEAKVPQARNPGAGSGTQGGGK